MARKSLSTVLASVAPSVAPSTEPKSKEPKAVLSDVSAQVANHLSSRLISAGVSKADLPAPAAFAKETSALFVDDLAARLKSLGEAMVAASKSLSADGVSMKPKADGGRAVVHFPTTEGGVYTAATVSITYDGAIGQAIRDLFPRG